MFEVGFTEIILILGVALLVLGPEKLPALAEKVGRWTGRARSMARQLRTQLEQEVTIEQMTKTKPMQAEKPASSTAAAATPDPAPPSGFDLDQHFAETEATNSSPTEASSTEMNPTDRTANTTGAAAQEWPSATDASDEECTPERMHGIQKDKVETQ